jgi:hypothetical protein
MGYPRAMGRRTPPPVYARCRKNHVLRDADGNPLKEPQRALAVACKDCAAGKPRGNGHRQGVSKHQALAYERYAKARGWVPPADPIDPAPEPKPEAPGAPVDEVAKSDDVGATSPVDEVASEKSDRGTPPEAAEVEDADDKQPRTKGRSRLERVILRGEPGKVEKFAAAVASMGLSRATGVNLEESKLPLTRIRRTKEGNKLEASYGKGSDLLANTFADLSAALNLSGIEIPDVPWWAPSVVNSIVIAGALVIAARVGQTTFDAEAFQADVMRMVVQMMEQREREAAPESAPQEQPTTPSTPAAQPSNVVPMRGV